jgi:hypothetical protein
MPILFALGFFALVYLSYALSLFVREPLRF